MQYSANIVKPFVDESYIMDAVIGEANYLINNDSKNLILSRIVMSDTEYANVKKMLIVFKYGFHACLIFIKYLFDDHVTLHCVKMNAAKTNFIVCHDDIHMMPRMKYISDITCCIAHDEPINKKWFHKNVPKLKSHLYGQRLYDIDIVLTNNEN